MKNSELRAKSIDELRTNLGEKQAELIEKQRALHAGELTNPRNIREIRREIARLHTVVGEMSVAVAEEEQK